MSTDIHPVAHRDQVVADQPTVIAAAGLGKSYAGRRVVQDVDLQIRAGEFFGVLGPNGAGKTTLIEMIEGLRRPDEGSVRVLGADPGRRDHEVLSRLGVQTQKGAFFTRLTCAEHLRTMAALYRVGPEAARAALASVGLESSAGVRTDRLSGGQRQRLSIAAALVHSPDIIFLDEPTAALDPQARRELWTLLRTLRSQGRTIIYTTHHLDEAEALCDRVAIMVGGRIQALDSPHRLKLQRSVGSRISVPIEKLDAAAASAIEGVDQVLPSGDVLILATRTPSEVLLRLNAICGLDDVETRTTSLEDVYLELTCATTTEETTS